MAEGPAPPGIIAKGLVNRKVDNTCNDLSKRDAFLAALRDAGRDFVQILIEHASVTSREADHLRRYWFNDKWAAPDSGCWWQDKQPIVSIVRQGLIKALEVATQDPDTGEKRSLPIDSYWLSGGATFEVIVTCSPQQITRIILTPPVPVHLPGNLTARAPIWVVKHSTPGEEVERTENGVLVARLKTVAY
jgi:hypothetical protein